GPAVNMAIAVVLTLALGLSSSEPNNPRILLQPMTGNLPLDLLRANIVLVLFNMLPAFPMDGGRVLRALLVKPLGRLTATEVAAALGGLFALLFGLGGLLTFNPMLILIGLFAYLAGRQELAAVRYQEEIRHAEPLDVVPTDTEILDAIPATLGEHFTGSVFDHQTGMCVIWRHGRPVHAYRVH